MEGLADAIHCGNAAMVHGMVLFTPMVADLYKCTFVRNPKRRLAVASLSISAMNVAMNVVRYLYLGEQPGKCAQNRLNSFNSFLNAGTIILHKNIERCEQYREYKLLFVQ